MTISVRILPELSLVYIRYSGLALVAEGADAFAAYLRHPDFRPGQRQLVDLSAVTEVERDFPRLFRLQAEKAAAFMGHEHPVMLVYLAPNEISLGMARLIERSWEGLDGVLVRVASTLQEVNEILGLRADVLEESLARGV
ncbi:hypothetical protein AB9K41_13785 [Cribrihabitans sp. XS_ASV171]